VLTTAADAARKYSVGLEKGTELGGNLATK